MSLSGIVHVTGCPHYQGLSFRLRIRTGPQNRLHLCGHREAKTQNRLVQGWPRALRSPLPSCKTFLPNHKKDYGFSWKIPLLSSLLSALQISEWYKGKRRLKSKMEIDPATQVHLINDPTFLPIKLHDFLQLICLLFCCREMPVYTNAMPTINGRWICGAFEQTTTFSSIRSNSLLYHQ